MLRILHAANFAGSPQRLEELASVFERHDFTCFEDFDGYDIAPMPGEILALLSEHEKQWLERFSKLASQKNASPVHLRVEHQGEGSSEPTTTARECPVSIIDFAATFDTHDTRGNGPTAACKRLKTELADAADHALWVENARLHAILGACPHSHKSVASGLRCWIAFAQQVLRKTGKEFPPVEEDLLAWSALFRSGGTFANYVNYVRVGCDLLGVSSEATRAPAVRRARISIDKRRHFILRERMFMQEDLLVKLMDAAICDGQRTFALALLTTYIFLLRMPSECLPIVVDRTGTVTGSAVFARTGDSITLRLERRKNKPGGSRITRTCWCRSCARTCPIHVLGNFIDQLEDGEHLFKDLTQAKALKLLRHLLGQLEVENAQLYRLHDIRRGHAKDLQLRGAGLAEILRAGEWRSPAFLSYLDLHTLERDVVVEALLGESSDTDAD